MVTADMMNRMNQQDFHGLVHCGDMSYADKYNGSRGDYATQVGRLEICNYHDFTQI